MGMGSSMPNFGNSMPMMGSFNPGPQAYGPGGYATMMGPPPALPGSSFSGPPPSAPFTAPPSASFTAPPFMQSQGAFPDPRSMQKMANPNLRPGELIVEVTRLLDMPMQEKFFSGDLKQYRVRAFDDYDGEPGKEIGRTQELAGIPEGFATAGDVDTETVRLGGEGILSLKNSQTPVIHIQVLYAGGFLGNKTIGSCRIARADQRSGQIWPYALSNRHEEPVGCGIELRVMEGPPLAPMMMQPGLDGPSFQTMPPMGPSHQTMPPTMGPSFQTMPPMSGGMMPPTMGQSTPPGSGMFGKGFGKGEPPTSWLPGNTPPTSPRGAQPNFQTMAPQNQQGPSWQTMPPQGMEGMPPTGTLPTSGAFGSGAAPQSVFVLVEIDKLTDLPGPVGGGPGMVMLGLTRANGGGAIGPPAGPFPTDAQGNLRQAVNLQGRLEAQVSMEDQAKGAMDVCVMAIYQGNQPQAIGRAPLSVSWKPEPLKYTQLSDDKQQSAGGIYLAHRFVQEADLQRSMIRPAAPAAVPQQKERRPPNNSQLDTNTRSGKFKRGSDQEVIETAALAMEAQNRALHQRVNLATQYSSEVSADQQTAAGSMWQNENGYRDWSTLDSVFITMGPNYVAQSNEVGANVCRVYEERTSVWQEIKNKNGLRPANAAEEPYAKELVGTMYRGDPDAVQKTLRPVICKDVKDIAREGLRDAKKLPVLRVNVLNAQNLRTNEGFIQGEVHPKVVVEIPGKPGSKWETRAASDGRHVQWNEEGVIPGYNYGDALKITVVDKGWLGFVGETHLGEARLGGSDFYPEAFNAGLPLAGASGGNSPNKPGQQRAENRTATINLAIIVEEPTGSGSNWPPYPPMYAPVSNLNESDQETQRLANWDVKQNCKLPFADVNPNYQVNEDIWGAQATGKAVGENVFLEKPPDWQQPRVKDQCPIA